jgi:hypothetical protein
MAEQAEGFVGGFGVVVEVGDGGAGANYGTDRAC